MNENKFIEELKKLNIELTKKQLEQLDKYYNLLIEWNEKINLTAIVEKKDVYLKHFYDSLTLFKEYDLNKKIKLCDMGTGAGFPGIVLKIVFPNIEVDLVDALMKRVNFLNLVIKELGLENIKAIHSRIEEYSINHKEEYDLITARAVANLSTLTELSAQALKITGKMIFLKGEVTEEINNITNALNILNLKLEKVTKFLLPIENSNRSLVVILKEKKTPSKYPRKFSDIKNKPL